MHEGLPIDAVDYRNYVSVHRMVMENRPVDPGSIQGSHRPISFTRIKHRTRERFFFFVKLSSNNHIVGLIHNKPYYKLNIE